MKSDLFKSQLDLTKYAFLTAFCLALIILQFSGLLQSGFLQNILLTQRGEIRDFGLKTELFFDELLNKSFVLEENIRLKAEIDLLKSQKEDLDRLKKEKEFLVQQTSIEMPGSRQYKAFSVRGVLNIYSFDPYILLDIRGYKVNTGNVVYSRPGKLFGIVTEVNNTTATVIPFYSSRIGFNLPVKSLENNNNIGFVKPITNGEIRIINVDRKANISIGDTWVTTSDRDEIPSDIIVGEVERVVDNSETGYKELILKSDIEPTDLQFLFLELYE